MLTLHPKGDRLRALPAFRALRPPVRRRPLPPAPIFSCPYGVALPSPAHPPSSPPSFRSRDANAVLPREHRRILPYDAPLPPRRPFVLSAFVMAPLHLHSPCCLSRPIALRLLSPCCCPVRHPVCLLPYSLPSLALFPVPSAIPFAFSLPTARRTGGWRCAVGGVGRDFSSTARSRLYGPAWLLPMVGGRRIINNGLAFTPLPPGLFL
uniref:Uncharacterized protein n=1 Tax=Ananas comosus var. bracteatus TaxID=296719 RepID=A0A6V7Q0D6_ANACO|nr:unnamed protein product [Ananas comosus var. bracteatus]